MNRGFGPLAPQWLPRAPTPVGLACLHCGEPIAENDSGTIMAYIGEEGARPAATHRECEIRSVAGSVGHQRGLCSCNGGPGTMDDPPGMTKREAAIAAEREFQRRHRRTEA